MPRLPCCLVVLSVLLLGGCGAPGEPVPPRPEIPQPILDLAVHQEGASVAVVFSLSNQRTTEGQPFQRTPDIEIYRNVESPDGSLTQPTELLRTIPGTLVDAYGTQGHFRFADPLQPGDFRRYAGRRLAYAVRASFSARHLSEPSNVAALRVFPPARPPTGLLIKQTKSAIELSWTAPTELVTGAPLAIVDGYRVYRAEVAPDMVSDALTHREKDKLIAPFSLLGSTPSTEYRDTTFQFNHGYLYAVRAVVQFSAVSVESDDSPWIGAAPLDVFPPSAPQGLEAVGVPAGGPLPVRVELSWAINPETDIEGYNIYRRDAGAATMQRLNQSPLPTPVFRDTAVEVGRTYIYQVTAVSGAGIESARSAEVSAGAPAPGDQNP
jgi:hypothetical protein